MGELSHDKSFCTTSGASDDPQTRGRVYRTSRRAFIVRLKKLLRECGGRSALAAAAGIPDSTIASYLAGVEPTRSRLIKIAKAAKVRVGWLVGGDGAMRRTTNRKNCRPWPRPISGRNAASSPRRPISVSRPRSAYQIGHANPTSTPISPSLKKLRRRNGRRAKTTPPRSSVTVQHVMLTSRQELCALSLRWPASSGLRFPNCGTG